MVFFIALYQCVESQLWKHIFTPSSYFMANIKQSASGGAVLPSYSGGFYLNELGVVVLICGTKVTWLAFSL